MCSAHPLVLDETVRHGAAGDHVVLIEATCNQVNQDGGYTGMRPVDFRREVEQLAEQYGLPAERLVLGGDHLGPNPWKHLPAETAMAKAEELVEAFVRAGLHQDPPRHLDPLRRRPARCRWRRRWWPSGRRGWRSWPSGRRPTAASSRAT